MFGRRACIPPLAAAVALGECLLGLASRSHKVGHIEPDDDVDYSMGRNESDVEDQYFDVESLESFRYFTEEMVSGQHQAVVTCQDPARYQVECLSWQHLCPDSGRPQPSIFDDFMAEWCPKTCGLCVNDKVADDLEVSLDAQQRDEEGHKCKAHMVSRRRNTGDQCSCRRRSNAKGLSPGWACKGDHIEWEGFDTDENSEKPVFCCCKQGECTYESIRRGDSVQHFNLLERNGTWCCKNKFGDKDSGYCPYYSGYRHREELDMCRHPYVEPTIHACSDRVHRWLSDMNWYKLVTGWEYQQISYESYIPCMVSQFKHTRGHMLTMKNALASISMENPMRGFIISLPECSGLTGKDLVKSVDIAYEKQCPFGLPNSAYKPDLVSDGACSYDPLDRTINLQGSMMCVEGHRCACPVFEKTNTVVNSAMAAYSTYAVSYSIIKGARAAAEYAQQVGEALIGYGWVATYAASALGLLSAHVWALSGGIGALALLTFSGSYVWTWAHHTCSRNVGCYPMDCVEEPMGCRIRPPENFDDERNPYWFMPPPTYKCAYRRGRCGLRPCTKQNLWNQTVGLHLSRSRTEGQTQVYNCQPMVYTDMSESQHALLEEKTASLREEYRTKEFMFRRMRRLLDESCPWVRPVADDVLRCNDLTSCYASKSKQTCCDFKGGIKQCPENFPLMCRDGYCGDDRDLCEGRGGVLPCPAGDDCPWLLPTIHKTVAECHDGSFDRLTSARNCACQGEKQGGVKRCPWDLPVMCANNHRKCGHLCRRDCRDHGGPRECPFLSNVSHYAHHS